MSRLLLAAALLLLPAVARAEATGEIDWSRRVIKARGQGAPDLNAPSISVARLGAERAAKVDALRNLLETLKGAEISSGDRVGTLLQNDNALRMKTEGQLRGFKVVQPHYYSDGGVALDVEVDLDKLPPELSKNLQPPAGAARDGGVADPRTVDGGTKGPDASSKPARDAQSKDPGSGGMPPPVRNDAATQPAKK